MKQGLWRWLTGARDDDEQRRAEIAEEIAAHVALRAQDNELAGMSPPEAARDASVRFGDAETTTRACLAARRRPLRRSLVAACAAGIMAVAGIGATLLISSPTVARARFARTAPFDGIRWSDPGATPSVRVDGTWWKLEAIDGVSTQDLLAASREAFGDRWKKRMEEDIVEVLIAAGSTPGDTVSLTLRDLETGQLVEEEDVPLTAENRREIWIAANPEFERWESRGHARNQQVMEAKLRELRDKLTESRGDAPREQDLQAKFRVLQDQITQSRADALRHQGGRGLPTLAPYDAIAWEGDVPRVSVDDRWVELLAIDHLAASDIVAASKDAFPGPRSPVRPDWQRRFEEDLVELLQLMGHEPGDVVDLRVRDLTSGAEEFLRGIAMTGENRRALSIAGNAREAAASPF